MAGPAYQWGRWRFEPSEARLLRDGVVVSLPAKTLDLLNTLLTRAPRLVTKEEILAAVWPDAAVEEGNIAFHVAALRKAIDEDDGESAIETVRGKGYRFIREFAIRQLPPTDALRKDALERAIAEHAIPTVDPAGVSRRRWIAIAVLAIVLAGGLGWSQWRRVRPEPFSIAVRPFTIVSPPPGQEHFPDGLRTYLGSKLALAGITTGAEDSAGALLLGQLQPLDGGFRVTVQLMRRSDNARVWDWSFVVPADAEMPSEGEDDARSRLQSVIATRTAEGIRSYLNVNGK
jgi:DNA-binding winged helix-turn-helix (wHTH) protein/TolB-like protein